MAGTAPTWIGLTYVAGAEHLVDACADIVDVIEIEPQTFWRRGEDGVVRPDDIALRRLADLPGARLIHGVGNPVGGCRLPDRWQIDLVAELAEQLRAPWVSEHLAYNRVVDAAGGFHTGFMLPPRQTVAGVERGVRSAAAMRHSLPVPLALEIGVNYLRPRADELTDGEFASQVVAGAGCGLLLDLHNVLANQRNGRGRVDDLLATLPLDRVWEVHLAGGLALDGYWLDAHHGLPDEELLELAARVLPRLPALRAVVFEATPSAVPSLDVAAVRDLLLRLRTVLAAPERVPAGNSPQAADPPPAGASPGPVAAPEEPEEWEQALGELAIGRRPATPLAEELAADPAIALLRGLIVEQRAGALSASLRYTIRLLLLQLGEPAVRELIEEYARSCPPCPFASDEAIGFAAHLRGAVTHVPHLSDVLDLDLGMTRVRVDGQPRTVTVHTDPQALMSALGAGQLPEATDAATYEVRLVDDRAPAPG